MKVSRQGPYRNSRVASLVLIAALALSACSGETPPGVAAEVEGDPITDTQVDELAAVLCALQGTAGGGVGMPTKAARYGSLEILLGNELAERVADVDGVERESLAAAMEQTKQIRDALPEELRDSFDEVTAEYSRAQNALAELGRTSLRRDGQKGAVPPEAASGEGERLLREYAKDADIDIDPRFGSMKEGVFQPGDGSLSVPVSELAVQAGELEPSPELVGLLPASQKCA